MATTVAATDGLLRSTPGACRVDAKRVEAFLDDVEAAGLELHALMLHRDDHVCAEGYWWPYRADRVQIMHSVAKSFAASAIGLALEEGHFALSDKVVSFFPDALPEVVSDKLAAMTVEDLLTMRTGHASEVGGPVWRAISTSWIEQFFNIPVVHQPGTTYVYSSSSSYMLAAILHKTTGQTLHQYLKPRLFDPIGITGETWDIGPDGFNPGGNGLTCKLSDLMKLGILHAQNGVWQGRRLLPEAWVTEATRNHVGPDEYGYHWVTYTNGIYAALGQFAQMVLVFPEQGATLGITAAIDGSDKIKPLIFKHFFLAFTDRPIDDPDADDRLARRLAAKAAVPVLTSPADPVAFQQGRTVYRIEPNDLGVSEIAFDLSSGQLSFSLTDAQGQYRVTAGIGQWIESRTDMTGRELHHGYRLLDAVIVAGAAFPDTHTVELTWCYAETAFRDTVTCQFHDDRLTIDRKVNINSKLKKWQTLKGEKVTK